MDQNNNTTGYSAPPPHQNYYNAPPPPPNYGYGYAYNPYNHTGEFEPKDISENKVYALLLYLLGVFGIIIGAVVAQRSPYVTFHLRQRSKILIVEILLGMIGVFFFWTIIVPILAVILYLILWVIQIICFVQICMNQATEPPIIRSLNFLK